MIAYRREHFLWLLSHWGTTLDAAQPCVVSDDGSTITVDEKHPAFPARKPGLGDAVKAGLSAVGITEERVSQAIGQPCGCSGRVSALNRFGARLGLPPGRS